ncbi:MAG: aldehyde dehydrogenase family protein [Candidatus Wallbacteria bacterium]|nr:aldehyde dehydrogenase family protein [Candidatus Wallbacteria bacterium]
MAAAYGNFINGKWITKGSRGTFENRSPADPSDVIGIFPESGHEEIEAAVRAAAEALPAWSRTPAPRRGEILRRVGDLLSKHKDEIAKLATREMGKVLAETRGDVQEGIDCAYYYAGEGRRMFGQTVPTELPNKFGMSIRRPIGVAGLITPWNFPLAIPTWKSFPALICGNTLVLKPAEDSPATAVKLMEIFEEAGVPKGVVNLVHGDGPNTGAALVKHEKIGVISFTGSSETGREIARLTGGSLKRCSLELGGKNAQIVMEDADLDLAIEGALWGAFGTTGQRCTATSRLIVHKKVASELTGRLVEQAKKLKLGNGLEESTQVGPLVNKTQRERVAGYCMVGQEEDGAKLLLGGKAPGGKLSKGYFFEPTVFAGVTPKMRIFQEEIFGPVIGIVEVKSFEEAIAALNDSRYGLSSSIYTKDVNRAFKAIEQIEAGITYINGPTIGAEVHLPFGGVKDTGNGHREAGITGLDIFSEWKAVYVDYSGKLQKAQIDTHPDD